METELDSETLKLAGGIRELLGAHLLKFKDHRYQNVLVSCLIALAIETGKIRWLTVELEEIDVEKFDSIFLTAVVKHFDENRRKCGGSH